jgi:Flp pilus assembly protein TadG
MRALLCRASARGSLLTAQERARAGNVGLIMALATPVALTLSAMAFDFSVVVNAKADCRTLQMAQPLQRHAN